jgi:hypothetical protein
MMTLKKLFAGLLVLALLVLLMPTPALAAGLTSTSDTLSREQISQSSSHVIKFTSASAIQTAGDTIVITFPSDFNFTSKTISTITFTHGASTGLESTETLAASPSASAWGAVFSGTQNRVLTLTAPTDGIGAAAVAAANKLIISYDSTNSINASSAANYIVTINTTGSSSQSGTLAIALVSADQYLVSATVDPTITFSISNTATNFGTLSGAVTTSATDIVATISTNAANGYSVTISDQGNGVNPGLNNATANYLLGSADGSYSATTDLTSAYGYGIQASSGTATVAARYNQTGNTVGGLSRTAQALASSTGVADTHQVTIVSKARVSGSVPAGNYTDSVTLIATANF